MTEPESPESGSAPEEPGPVPEESARAPDAGPAPRPPDYELVEPAGPDHSHYYVGDRESPAEQRPEYEEDEPTEINEPEGREEVLDVEA
jgi:hypothetical protein